MATDALAQLSAKFEEDLAARAAKEKALTEERKDAAERDLDERSRGVLSPASSARVEGRLRAWFDDAP